MAHTHKPVRPWNVFVAPQSPAKRAFGARRGMAPREIAPGVGPSPEHDLVFHGGRTIPNLTFTNFYVGGQSAWAPSDIQNVDRALAAAMSDPQLNNVMGQYFPAGQIASAFRSSTVLPDAVSGTLFKNDVESLVTTLYQNGQLAGYDLSTTVFNLMLPSGIVLSADPSAEGDGQEGRQVSRAVTVESEDADSLHGLGGYHGSVHPSKSDGTPDTVYYAVGAYSETRPDGTVNGIPVFDQPWKNVVATFYHELNEARTDADVEDAIAAGNDPSADRFLGWVSAQGEECGDYPVFEANPLTQVFQEVALADGSGTAPVQFQYSNAVHGPEGPIPQPDPPATTGGQ